MHPPADPGVLAAVCALAREAGAAIEAVRASLTAAAVGAPLTASAVGAPLTADAVQAKGDGSPVTAADLAAHQCIRRGLAALTAGWPVLSEEDDVPATRPVAWPRWWLIDPLDGTREFVAGRPEYTVNIALMDGPRAVWGVVHAPASGLLWHGGAGWGAWREATPGRAQALPLAPAPDAGRPVRVLASRSHLDDATRRWIAALGDCTPVHAGSSLKFCLLAEGGADVYPRFGPTAEWDTAAGQAVLEGAGGEVLTLDGEPLRYGRREVINPSFIAMARRDVRWWPGTPRPSTGSGRTGVDSG